MILAGDIGGTKTHLAIFTQENKQLLTVADKVYSSKNYPSLMAVIQEFLAQIHVDDAIEAACFGIAGPIIDDRCSVTNLPWIITVTDLRQLLHCDKVILLNDLEAIGYGIPCITAAELVNLNPAAQPRPGNAALIAAGTGLGEALLFWDGQLLRPSASEGGNVDFAPRTELQMDLLRYLMHRTSHVSYEQVLSGPGLFNIYQFLRDSGRGVEPDWLSARLSQEDPAAVISSLAIDNVLCGQALDIFAAIYGAEAGNLALKFMASGGVYVGGGIATKILDKLRDGTFMRSFTDKGRFADLVSTIPVYVILNPKVGLLGAGRRASL